ncbi:restriction endonuclease subunit S [Flavobacterium franklandianum]|uniref:Restriction endonuclease subunit S n=1 Tax=Flavobacterium franklandianum TaxID=2594430 RepID=A0A553CTC3_9FLAO|nr:restriction endonuclease subunit S [Flavobacterium franklandianum]TRX23786.1 restriction endonuclease subunit S [Flavobacterium franklandianum]
MPTANNNTPALRFPEFKGGWELKKFGEVANFKVTNSFSRENLNYGNGVVKNIHYGDIHTKFQTLFDITKEIVPFINEEISINRISDDFYCKEGDIIFADASEDLNDVGKSIEIVNLNNEKLLSGLHTLLARPIEKTFKIGFNGFLFKSNNIRLQVQKESQGSKVLSINVGRISGIKISFPTLPEQQKIATFLTAVDEKLQVLKQKKSLLEQYKKGVMQKLFSQELRFKDDTGKAFADWEEKKLGELGIYVSDGNYGELYPRADQMVSSGVPFIRANNIKNLKLTMNDMKFIDAEHHKILKSGHLKTGDILVTTRGDIGMLAYVSEEFNNSNINAQICLLRVAVNLNSRFLLNYLCSSWGISQFKALQTGSALKQLPRSSLAKIIIKVPCLEEQTKIAAFLSTIDDKINQCQAQITNTEVWKKGLLQGMFV